ncbi:unnamed protein product [Hymenolepis diminuta]|uniref:Peptidase A2 domain-containing protein n=1 Tax=Hymenolepis diminuta TaxID=6216 RepID=A0A564Y0G8_HYMDI|nr:unnamed protein product [Hymenolepis diminuta]
MRCLAPYIGMQDDLWKILFFQHLPPQIQLELGDKLLRYSVDQIAHIADIIEDIVHQPPDNRLYITDRNSGTHFLIDSGSRFSIILPKSGKRKTLTPISYMEYEERKKIAIYGWQELVVDLGPKQTLKWNFLIADVIRPIIGADFLTYFDLTIDFKRKTLIENQSIPILREGISTKRVHSSTNHCLCIIDSISGLKFLIDSGAMRSLIPRMPNEKLTPLPYNRFVSANQSPVLEYGYKHLNVHLGLDEFFPWNFIIADIDVPLIGADFLSHFGLSVDLKGRKLFMNLSE